MAPRRSTAAKTTVDAPAPAGLTLKLAQSKGITRKASRTATPVPADVVNALQSTLESGEPLAYQDLADDQVKPVQTLLRRAAATLNVGLRTSVDDEEDGTKTVNFRAVGAKVARKYNSDDIRAWYAEINGEALPAGKIPSSVRKSFRVANGYEKADAESAE